MEEEILKVLVDIKEELKTSKKPKMLFAKDIANILHINLNEATDILKRDDINSIRIGRLKIEETQFYDWLQSKREK